MTQMTRSTSMNHLETESIGGYSHTTSIASEMRIKHNVRTLCERVQSALRHGRRKEKREMDISAPFDLKLVPVTIPGVSQEELAILREKAAASRIGVAEESMYPDPPLLPMPRRTRSPYGRAPSPLQSAVSTQQQHHQLW